MSALLGPAAAESATTQTKTYSTPGLYSFTVPNNVISITVHAVGAAGGSCSLASTTDPLAGHGGQGAAATGTLVVKPGAKLIVAVGGTGGACVSSGSSGGAGGMNGGAAGGPPETLRPSGAGGGGASAVLASATSPLVVAGGGGGAAYCGGNGGNADSAGTSGALCQNDGGTPGGGGGKGTLLTGGSGGTAGLPGGSAGGSGTVENGGAGGAGDSSAYSGGGGGGGVHGGGGGGGGGTYNNGGGGGGGGASFVLPAATNISLPSATAAPAEVTITYAAVPPPKATTHKATGVKQTSGTVHGTVNGEGLKTTYWFQWGTSKSYGHTTGMHKTGGKITSVLALLTHLKAGTTYHFRVVAKTASGTAHGKDMTFTTPKPRVKPVFTG